MKLKEIYLGTADGEEEGLRSDFSDLYLDYENIVEKTLEPSCYLVLGRKGTGKTVLGLYLKKVMSSVEFNITRITYGDLTISTFSSTEKSVNDDDYYNLFQWIFLIELCKRIIDNKSLEDVEEFKYISEYVATNFTKTNPSSPSFIKRLLNRGIKLGFDFITNIPTLSIGDQNNQLDLQRLPILIDDLKINIEPLLRSSNDFGYKYLIVIDDIDNHINLTETGKKVLKGLLNAIHTVNTYVRNFNNGSKILLLLRTDIFNSINAPILNKLSTDHSIKLNWGYELELNSPIIDLVLFKIKSSVQDYKFLDTELLWKKLFPDSLRTVIDGSPRTIPTYLYLLSRTFMRPRDFIQFLKFIKEGFGELRYFNDYSILKTEERYSKWLKQEVASELINHYNDEEIEDLFTVASFLDATKFGANRIISSKILNHLKSELTVPEALKILYRYSVLGQFWTDANGETNYRFSYEDDEDITDKAGFLTNNFILHFGLRKALLNKDHQKVKN